MRLTQGAFSFLPDLTDAQILKQVEYGISKGWAIVLNGQMIHTHVITTGNYGVYRYLILRIRQR